nr:transposase [Paenibacillus humicola]
MTDRPNVIASFTDDILIGTHSMGSIAAQRKRICASVRRMIEPESVFGRIKNNRGFFRFLLRGFPKVSLEVGWLTLAHNLLKKSANPKNKVAERV